MEAAKDLAKLLEEALVMDINEKAILCNRLYVWFFGG
ncbi:hypothetical protein QF049_001356 [Paenibacillus sp. W4I10]|nr:hypothetical protein [Paenibacillus sp. W4I10]